MNENIINKFYDLIQQFEIYIANDETLSKLELNNLNDENVFYVIVYLISAFLIFLLFILNIFYQSKKTDKTKTEKKSIS